MISLIKISIHTQFPSLHTLFSNPANPQEYLEELLHILRTVPICLKLPSIARISHDLVQTLGIVVFDLLIRQR